MSPVFDGYSRYYDLLYRDKDYSAEAAYVLGQILAHKGQATRILELGCGTGAHAIALAHRGASVTGIDRSESMLRSARERIKSEPAETRSRIQVVQGDVRSIRTGEKYDAVISLFHVISYMNADQDLIMAFQSAARHLLPGGLFMFDYWFGPAVLAQKPEVRVRRLADSDCTVTRIAEPEFRPGQNIVDVHYTLFIEERASGTIARLQETHSMRYLFLPELCELAAEWFEPLDSRAWLADSPPDTSTWSAFTTMVRKR
jgi:SAM-dependent methyltransferase